MKKVMMLGGNYYQMTAVLAAKRLGLKVIDVDYLPENPAHQYADEYYNISTIDREKVLEKAKELKIDAIISYASDISAPTAAYVSEQLGLRTNPLSSVELMTNKEQFRKFLRENGFPSPENKSFIQLDDALDYYLSKNYIFMVKPIDASGSKGVTKINPKDSNAFKKAWKEAIKYSISKTVVLEEYIQKKGYQIDGDVFVEDGKVVFFGICDQHNDVECSLYAPTASSFPSVQDEKYQIECKKQLERLLSLLDMKMGAYNLEYIIGEDDKIYFMEIGPRNGGNLITDTIKESCGIDLAEYTIRQALGEKIDVPRNITINNPCSSFILHSTKDGIFKRIHYADEVKDRLLMERIFVKPGEEIHRFVNGGFGIGAIVLKFDNTTQMCEMIDNMNRYIKVETE